MESHIKIIGILHVILGGMGIFAAITIFLLFGGLAGLAGMANQGSDGQLGGIVIGGIGGLIAIVLMAFSLPGFIGGIGLLTMASWSRMYMIVISALHLLHIPIGTALGIYGLWALTRPETEALFRQRAYRTA